MNEIKIELRDENVRKCRYCDNYFEINLIGPEKRFCDYTCSKKYNSMKTKYRDIVRKEFWKKHEREIEIKAMTLFKLALNKLKESKEAK